MSICKEARKEEFRLRLARVLAAHPILLAHNNFTLEFNRKKQKALEEASRELHPYAIDTIKKQILQLRKHYTIQEDEIEEKGGEYPEWMKLVKPMMDDYNKIVLINNNQKPIVAKRITAAKKTAAAKKVTAAKKQEALKAGGDVGAVSGSAQEVCDVMRALTERARAMKTVDGAALCKDMPGQKQLQRVWESMLSISQSKLEMLVCAGDCEAGLPAAARLRPLEWRALDLRLLHAGHSVLSPHHYVQLEPLQALVAVFHLVQLYSLEEEPAGGGGGGCGPGAWRVAAHAYRQRGRVASAVLLQRRWHDLKSHTRLRMLAASRGVSEPRPAPIHTAVARRFQHVVTGPLPRWHELVSAGRVFVETEEMESSPPPECSIPVTDVSSPHDEDDDLVLIEREIETIDLINLEDAGVIMPKLTSIKQEPNQGEDFKEALRNRRRKIAQALEEELDRQLQDLEGQDPKAELSSLPLNAGEEGRLVICESDDEAVEEQDAASVASVSSTKSVARSCTSDLNSYENEGKSKQSNELVNKAVGLVNKSNVSVVKSEGSVNKSNLTVNKSDISMSKLKVLVDKTDNLEYKSNATVNMPNVSVNKSNICVNETVNKSMNSEKKSISTVHVPNVSVNKCIGSGNKNNDSVNKPLDSGNKSNISVNKSNDSVLNRKRRIKTEPLEAPTNETIGHIESQHSVSSKDLTVSGLLQSLSHVKFERSSDDESAPHAATDTVVLLDSDCSEEEEEVIDIDPKLLMSTLVPLPRVDLTAPWRRHATASSLSVSSLRPAEVDQLAPKRRRLLDFMSTAKELVHSLLELPTVKVEGTSVSSGRSPVKRVSSPEEGSGRVAKRVQLPDIADVRRINQGLLVAQVPPLSTAAQDHVAEEQPRANGSSGNWWSSKCSEGVLSAEQLQSVLDRLNTVLPNEHGTRGGPYCCAARRHRAFNDARRRHAARAGKPPPAEIDVHGARCKKRGACECCCHHVLDACNAARTIARNERQLYKDIRGMFSQEEGEIEQMELDDNDDDDEVKKEKHKKKPALKQRDTKQNKKLTRNVQHREVERPKADPLEEWNRQKNLNSRFFDLNLKPAPSKSSKISDEMVNSMPEPEMKKKTVFIPSKDGTLVQTIVSLKPTVDKVEDSSTESNKKVIDPRIIKLKNGSPTDRVVPLMFPKVVKNVTNESQKIVLRRVESKMSRVDASSAKHVEVSVAKCEKSYVTGTGPGGKKIVMFKRNCVPEQVRQGPAAANNMAVLTKVQQPASLLRPVPPRDRTPGTALPPGRSPVSGGARSFTLQVVSLPAAALPAPVVDLCHSDDEVSLTEPPATFQPLKKQLAVKNRNILGRLPLGITVRPPAAPRPAPAAPPVLLNSPTLEVSPVVKGQAAIKVFQISESGALTPYLAPKAPRPAPAPKTLKPSNRCEMMAVKRKPRSAPGLASITAVPPAVSPRILNATLDSQFATDSEIDEVKTTGGQVVVVMRRKPYLGNARPQPVRKFLSRTLPKEIKPPRVSAQVSLDPPQFKHVRIAPRPDPKPPVRVLSIGIEPLTSTDPLSTPIDSTTTTMPRIKMVHSVTSAAYDSVPMPPVLKSMLKESTDEGVKSEKQSDSNHPIDSVCISFEPDSCNQMEVETNEATSDPYELLPVSPEMKLVYPESPPPPTRPSRRAARDARAKMNELFKEGAEEGVGAEYVDVHGADCDDDQDFRIEGELVTRDDDGDQEPTPRADSDAPLRSALDAACVKAGVDHWF